jgi:DNA-binding MarR family transcriptional regulator
MKTTLRTATTADSVVDMEVRAHEDHHDSLRLWLRLLSCSTRIESSIRQRLREQFDTTLPRFDLMAQLEREPEGLSMGDLSRRMMVTGGNVTAIVDQLEQERLVVRKPLQGDRRAHRVCLTASGRKAFDQMAQVHEDWVVDMLSPLNERQQNQMYKLLGHLKHGQLPPHEKEPS